MTTCTYRVGVCMSDDHGGKHPDLLSFLCPLGECSVSHIHSNRKRVHVSFTCRGEPWTSDIDEVNKRAV